MIVQKRHHKCFKLESDKGWPEAGRRGARWKKFTFTLVDFRHLKVNLNIYLQQIYMFSDKVRYLRLVWENVIANASRVANAVVKEDDTVACHVLDHHLSLELRQFILVEGFYVAVDEETFDFLFLQCYYDFVHRLESWNKKESQITKIVQRRVMLTQGISDTIE